MEKLLTQRTDCQNGNVRASVRTELKALAAAKLVTIATVLLMWARNHRFFYRDDVEHQMIGAFTALHRAGYSLGSIVGFRTSWALSLLVGETQFGVFNPLSPLRNAVAAMGDNLALNEDKPEDPWSSAPLQNDPQRLRQLRQELFEIRGLLD